MPIFMHFGQSAGTPPSNGLLTGLDSYYAFENDATDEHGSNNGTAYNITYDATNVKIGTYSASFNGTTSYIALATEAGQYPANDFSLGAWLKTSNGAVQAVFDINFSSSSSNARDAGYEILTLASGGYAIGIVTVGGLDTYFASTGTGYNDGDWHHLVVVRDGSDILFYIDGDLDSTHSYNSNNIDFDGSDYDDGTVNIGRISRVGYSGDFFSGNIDEAFIYSTALTSTQISQLYNSGSGLAYSSFTS